MHDTKKDRFSQAVLYKNFDKLTVVFQGALSPQQKELLEQKKEKAREEKQDQVHKLGSATVRSCKSAYGCYAYMCQIGKDETWCFSSNLNRLNWNIEVTIESNGFIGKTFNQVRDSIFLRLQEFDIEVFGEGIQRFDYAVDFLLPVFNIEPDNFVKHHNVKTRRVDEEIESYKKGVVSSSVSVDTITLGTNPNRQVTIYNKSKEAQQKKDKKHWFDVWGVTKKDRVFRVEMRFFKDHLKKRWNIRTFEQLEKYIGDVLLNCISKMRYVSERIEGNISRSPIHPLWEELREELKTVFDDSMNGLLPADVKKIVTQNTIDSTNIQFLGYIPSIVLLNGNKTKSTKEDIKKTISGLVDKYVDRYEVDIFKKVNKKRDQYIFLDQEVMRNVA